MSNPYNFPYTPYPVQNELMTAIHDCLESSSVGCFESPTGTGKSLSAICASLHWLVNEEQKVISSVPTSTTATTTSSGDDWFATFTSGSDTQKDQSDKQWNEAKSQYDNMKKQIASSRNNVHQSSQPAQSYQSVKDIVSTENDEFLLTNEEKHEESDAEDNEQETQHYGDILKLPQIYYCSRTHSQLAQFIAEVRKTVHKNIRCVTLGSRKNLCVNEDVKKLKTESGISERCLELQKEKGTTLKDSKNGEGGDSVDKKVRKTVTPGKGCQYHNKNAENQLVNYELREVIDLEDLLSVASSTDGNNRRILQQPACPYYASRKAMKHAQLVCLPYNLLLHNELRKSIGLDLTNKVIIVDEAHNLVEAINQMYSAEVSFQDIDTVIRAIGAYLTRYQTQLSTQNIQNLNILLSCIRKFKQHSHKIVKNRSTVSNHSDGHSSSTNSNVTVSSAALTVNDYLFSVQADNVNLSKLTKFITATNLSDKICGYYAKSLLLSVTPSTSDVNISNVIASFRSVIRLLQCFTNADSDGKVILKEVWNEKTSSVDGVMITYVLLNPSTFFTPIVEQTRSVILLGGTLQPFSHLFHNLFPWYTGEVDSFSSTHGVWQRQCMLPSGVEKTLRLFSCGHVVKSSNVKVLAVTQGQKGQVFQFTSDQRYSNNMINELLSVLCGLASVIPGGMVVFFTSYAYLEFVAARWKSTGGLDKLSQLKPIFMEKSKPNQTTHSNNNNNVWDDYCRQIKLSSHASNKDSGAVLFSVIGGSLSEGINFSDNLARCVVVVGMPFPDHRDTLIQQKMDHANKQAGSSHRSGGMDAGHKLLETMCMKAVNQTIGRSIRHANDYASIVLLDRRYSEERVSKQLPGWIRTTYEVVKEPFNVESNDGPLQELEQFYKEKESSRK